MIVNMLNLSLRLVAVNRLGTFSLMSRNAFCTVPEQKKLFTPGPLNTSMAVKEAMLRDLGSRDVTFLQIIRSIRQRLVEIAGGDMNTFTAVPMQGTGTFAIEAAFQSAVARDEKRNVLILENGSYGKRMAKICQTVGISHHVVSFPENRRVSASTVEKVLGDGSDFCMVALVHSETSSGLVNPIEEVGDILGKLGQKRPMYLVDAMSSFGAFPISVGKMPVDFLVSSANKCFEGVPGFAYVIARLEQLKKCKSNSRSLSLDLYDQWDGLEKTTQFRFTPPTHAMLAFWKALQTFEEEGGVVGRQQRYASNRAVLRQGMARLGFREYLEPPELTNDSYIITSYRYPKDAAFDFTKLYQKMSDKGLVLYPGKVLDADCFRVGSIGHLFPEDYTNFLNILEIVLKEMGVTVPVSY